MTLDELPTAFRIQNLFKMASYRNPYKHKPVMCLNLKYNKKNLLLHELCGILSMTIRISFQNIVSLPLTINHMLLKEKLKIKGKNCFCTLSSKNHVCCRLFILLELRELCCKTVISRTFPRNIVNLCLCVQRQTRSESFSFKN